MDILLKQRLIGAVVLIALAVIFVPVLLDGTGWRERRSGGAEIPPEPEFTFSRSLPTLSDARRDVIPPVAPAVEPQVSGQGASADAVSVTGDAPRISEQAKALESPTEDAAKRAEVSATSNEAPGAGSTTAGPSEKTPPVAPEHANPRGWVVQVGSFSSRKNAETLAAKLEASGYRAFIEPVGSETSRRYRVKVGPDRDKAAAMTTRTRLKSREKLSGIVVLQR
ncbi:MAG: SPOR domain-containing protein [Gammaproteobacteria bacterium]|jgi:DedD protein|nr:SPOR domain-containing protein [Gammaproteobacteria bacterium]